MCYRGEEQMYFLSTFNKHVQFVLVPLANGRMLKLFPIEWLQMVYVSGSNIKKKSGILKLCLKKDIEKNKVSILSVNCLTDDIDWTRVTYVY